MMSEWQPIETAPKDGTVILLYGPCEWDTCVTEESSKRMVIGSYEPYIYGDDGIDFAWLSETSNPYQDRIMATHWMPLPESPNEENGND